MSDKPDRLAQFFNLADALAEDLMAMSDEELLADAQEARDDLDREVAEMREIIAAAAVKAGKARLLKARASMDAARASKHPARLLSFPAADKRHVLDRLVRGDAQLREKLSAAARKGEGPSDREVDSMLQDLIDLGAIDEEGNPR